MIDLHRATTGALMAGAGILGLFGIDQSTPALAGELTIDGITGAVTLDATDVDGADILTVTEDGAIQVNGIGYVPPTRGVYGIGTGHSFHNLGEVTVEAGPNPVSNNGEGVGVFLFGSEIINDGLISVRTMSVGGGGAPNSALGVAGVINANTDSTVTNNGTAYAVAEAHGDPDLGFGSARATGSWPGLIRPPPIPGR